MENIKLIKCLMVNSLQFIKYYNKKVKCVKGKNKFSLDHQEGVWTFFTPGLRLLGIHTLACNEKF